MLRKIFCFFLIASLLVNAGLILRMQSHDRDLDACNLVNTELEKSLNISRSLEDSKSGQQKIHYFQKSFGDNGAFGDSIKSCEFMSRSDFLGAIGEDLKVLEIGPYYSPSLKGANVKYFDVLDKGGLEKKAAIDNLSIENIPNIDYIHSGGDMGIIKEKFDVVFSSHNIEHQVDLVRHLNQVSDVLKEGGKLYLIVPDKRYCFDRFIPETLLSEVLANHEEGRYRHSLSTILEACESTSNDPIGHWEGRASPLLSGLGCYNTRIKAFEDAKGGYIDAHKWRFTPQSFSYIINSLNELGLVDLRIEKIFCTQPNSIEFSAILVKYKDNKND